MKLTKNLLKERGWVYFTSVQKWWHVSLGHSSGLSLKEAAILESHSIKKELFDVALKELLDGGWIASTTNLELCYENRNLIYFYRDYAPGILYSFKGARDWMKYYNNLKEKENV